LAAPEGGLFYFPGRLRDGPNKRKGNEQKRREVRTAFSIYPIPFTRQIPLILPGRGEVGPVEKKIRKCGQKRSGNL
jgi:hypothetical protein